MQNFQSNFPYGHDYTRIFSNVQWCNFNILSIVLGLSLELGILCSYVNPF